jgi:heme/copper-type cytochrome/quinol oxidase subunit 2
MQMPSPTTKRFRYLPWLVVPLLGILILVIPIPARARNPVEHTFIVEASRFAYTPSILKVSQGDQVTIELTSQDVVHGLAVDGYDLEVQADPGQSGRLTFTADRPGTFRLRCSVTCGSMHPFMIGKLQVGNNDLLWRGAGLALLLVFVRLWKGYQ